VSGGQCPLPKCDTVRQHCGAVIIRTGKSAGISEKRTAVVACGSCQTAPSTEPVNNYLLLDLVGIAAENMEKSQHADFNEDTTNESASVM